MPVARRAGRKLHRDEDSAILERPRLISSASSAVSSKLISDARSPVLRWVKCRVKLVQASTSNQQFCNLHMRQKGISLTHQCIGSFRHGICQRSDLETRFVDLRIRQLVACG